MSIVDLYSRRKRQAEKAGQPEVYQYADVPQKLRVQIIQIWRDAIGPGLPPNPYGSTYNAPPNSEDWWREIHDLLAREKGMFALAKASNAPAQCSKYLVEASSVDDVLDVIEVTFRTILVIAQRRDQMQEGVYSWESEARRRGIKQSPEEAIDELNVRLREAGVGYQFENGQIVRIDSQYIHAAAVKPALTLLSDPRFQGPHEEFLHAHELHRTAKPNDHKALEDAIATALKAFESTLKVICGLSKWPLPANATAAPLIQAVIDNGLIPTYFQSSLEGLATLSNRISRHGQGQEMRTVQPYLAGYALHLAASNIVLLVEAFKQGKKP
ncbi:MAG: STM4504/CBY_0614 family protein [Candidatus Binataceae bacterium]